MAGIYGINTSGRSPADEGDKRSLWETAGNRPSVRRMRSFKILEILTYCDGHRFFMRALRCPKLSSASPAGFCANEPEARQKSFVFIVVEDIFRGLFRRGPAGGV